MEDPRHISSLQPRPDPTRDSRLRWWTDARLGMFIHSGPYTVLGHGEWAMQQENIPAAEYTAYGRQWCPRKGHMDELADLAVQAGMRYAVLTAKHCDGFQLWDSKVGEFNSVNYGPGRDLVREYVDAFRARGIRVGVYYCLMDWRHPDGDRCAIDEDARRRFVEFTHGNVRELMSNYGEIDILWFDGPWPMPTPEQWESMRLMRMVRDLQPGIVVNNRARLAEDFSTPEGEVAAQAPGRYWEACMTMNGDWGWADHPDGDWSSARAVLTMLRKASACGGNLLLNVGPLADGSAPAQARAVLEQVGRWLAQNGEAVFGQVSRIDGRLEAWLNCGYWTLKGNTGYFWLLRGHVGTEFSIGGIETKVLAVRLLSDGRALAFSQDQPRRLRISGLPSVNADPIAGCPVLEVQFASTPVQKLGAGMMLLPDSKAAWW